MAAKGLYIEREIYITELKPNKKYTFILLKMKTWTLLLWSLNTHNDKALSNNITLIH